LANKFRFFRKKYAVLNHEINRDHVLLRESQLAIMPILKLTNEESHKRMGQLIKGRCLFEGTNLHGILRRFFQLETEGILKIEWPKPPVDGDGAAKSSSGNDGKVHMLEDGNNHVSFENYRLYLM
jgi:hypothetical protein